MKGKCHKKHQGTCPLELNVEKGLLITLDFADERRFTMLDKAVASRVISSTTAKGSRVTKGPGGRKRRTVKTLRSPLRKSSLHLPSLPSPFYPENIESFQITGLILALRPGQEGLGKIRILVIVNRKLKETCWTLFRVSGASRVWRREQHKDRHSRLPSSTLQKPVPCPLSLPPYYTGRAVGADRC